MISIPKEGKIMINLSANVVTDKSPEQVAETIRSCLTQLPVSCHGTQIKLSPDARRALGGKRPAHVFMEKVEELLH